MLLLPQTNPESRSQQPPGHLLRCVQCTRQGPGTSENQERGLHILSEAGLGSRQSPQQSSLDHPLISAQVGLLTLPRVLEADIAARLYISQSPAVAAHTGPS